MKFRCSPMGHLAQMLVLFLLTICLLAPKFSSLTAEKQALLEFKCSLHDPLNYLHSWNSSNSPCHFFGISCDSITGKVTKISLINLNLEGKISSSISNLQSLTSLLLASNFFTGILPPELKNLTRLRFLDLTENLLFGEIPNLSMLKGLEVIDLSGNFFQGDFPVWVGNLTSLVSLRVGYNDFNEAKIPDSIANLKNLTRLYLRSINLIGELPGWVFNLTHLVELDVSMNQLSGKIPSSISQLSKLIYLELFQNNFSGELPPEIANLTVLRDFDISRNHLHGNLPAKMGYMKNLVYFQLYENHFSGELPREFAFLPFLSDFSIYRNSFSGPFPKEFGMFSPLKLIDISENEFIGEFPKYLCQKKKLLFMLALNNSFSGDFPVPYSNCKSLVRVRINKNRLYGEIPDELWALPHLSMIDLSDNQFSGKINSKISISTNLSQIILSNNNFSGELPQEIGCLTKLERLVLSNNGFSGEIPSHIKHLKQLSSLQLDSNSFSGSIPRELGESTSLSQLNLAGNSLNGKIPDSISMLHLNYLNISRNNISGLIPERLTSLKLSFVDLSENLLSGIIPIELYMIGGDNGFRGNKELCLPLNLILHVDSKIKRCIANQSPKESSFDGLVLCYALMASIAFVAICFVVVRFSHKLRVRKKMESKWRYKIFHSRIKIDASDIEGLKTENIIGKGSEGIVYKLDLHGQAQEKVAVKLLKGEDNKSFSNEIEVLAKVRHKNILKLYAYFKKGRCAHYLVLEFMEKGSLHEALHGESTWNQVLDFSTRYKIAVGVAQGIAYLHHDCVPSIIHRDIKPANILLDKDCEPKVSDFGIAMCSEMVSTSSHLLMGTHGYMAPELASTLRATKKSDVYSFGVVLLELLTGKKPNEEEFGEGIDIVSWARSLRCDPDGVQVFDPRLETTSTRVFDNMRNVMTIALLCTEPHPYSRPSMRNVVNMLLDWNY